MISGFLESAVTAGLSCVTAAAFATSRGTSSTGILSLSGSEEEKLIPAEILGMMGRIFTGSCRASGSVGETAQAREKLAKVAGNQVARIGRTLDVFCIMALEAWSVAADTQECCHEAARKHCNFYSVGQSHLILHLFCCLIAQDVQIVISILTNVVLCCIVPGTSDAVLLREQADKQTKPSQHLIYSRLDDLLYFIMHVCIELIIWGAGTLPKLL